ncbi:MAG: hypothetical protein IBJ04_02225 [Hydrogenophaga sp.]|uniref:DUF721 domain-containing protein n=1 Tax=Hydrogenophaga crocea TaxID=2716225 RepID=A0A6G8IN57_9BURK|nr:MULTISPECIES: DciA family protein [Hydrogenophaga]MBL0943132.1 hypothetical protein [Hydrogenophaga sp.]QIM54466.1 hypothetical protein G9Q37_20995 [Hydrogenophaga crocea]
MPAHRSPSFLSLQEAVGAAPTLALLRERAEASQRCLSLVRPLMPAGLRQQVAPGPWGDGEWCLLVGNAAAAAKLRQLLPAMREVLAENGAQVSAIRIKVQVPGR